MYVITGATGNTGKIISEQLLAAGKTVKVVGRSAERLADLTAKGGIPAVGDLADQDFLAQAFQGATAVYLVVPPKWDVTDWTAYQRSINASMVHAISTAGVKKAVLLSSQGAHLLEGAGPVSRMGELEQALQNIPGVDVLSLRPGFFMENLYGHIGLIKQAGIFGYTLQPDIKMPIVHTRDIAQVAFERLVALDFQEHTHAFIGGAADLTMPQVAAAIGQAIGKPDLAYVPFEPTAAKAGMMQSGIPETIADGYNELFDALNKGTYQEGYVRTPAVTTPTSIDWFAENEFKYAYQA
jgi:uncharacterized protein YbjT (DUF2867 family)